MSSPRRKPTDPPDRGDLIQVEWVDIAEDSTGDPTSAGLSRRTSFGMFWGDAESFGLPCIVTTTTMDADDTHGQQGYCIYPKACVVKLAVIKRARTHRHKKGGLGA